MADPLSIAGLALAVVETSKSIYDYVSTVKSAKDDIRRLSQEMFALKGTLDHMIAFQQSGTADARDPPQMDAVIKMTSETLSTISKRLERRHTGFGKSLQILSWPFQKTDTDKYVATLERAKTWFIMILMQDSSEQTSAVYAEVKRLADILHEDIISRQLDKMTLETEDTIRSLSPVNPAEDHSRVRRDLVPGTGGWFMDKTFEEWTDVSSSAQPLLWVKGKSGAGKSSLFSSVVEELNTRCSSRSGQSAYCFFYCHSGNLASQIPVNVFGSLLAQLCRVRPDMLSEIRPLLKSDNHLIPQSPLSISDLARLLTSVLDSMASCYMLVDALNETPHYRQIGSLLANLCQTCPNLRVLVTSTSDPPVKGKQILLRQMSSDIVNHDITVYVEHRLKTEASFSGLSDRIKTEIKSTMETEAHGMFRWVQLGMDRLSNLRTGRDVLMALHDLPSTLNDTYSMLLQRIPTHDRSLAVNAFTWLSFSVKRLTLRQLAEAVVLQETDRDLNEDFRLTDPGIVIEVCHGLVQLEDGYVTLAHDSFRSFLMSDWIKTSPVAQFALGDATSHKNIMRKCLTYLMFDEFSRGRIDNPKELVRRTRRYPLIDYAAFSWPDHAANTRLEKADEQLILDFFKTKALPKGGNFDSWVQALLGTTDTHTIERTQPLYYAASYNMVPIVKLLLRQGSDIDINKAGGRFGSTAFAIACYRGHSEVAKLLLEAGADPRVRDGGTGASALWTAKSNHMDEVVQMIKSRLKSGSDEKPAQPWWTQGNDKIIALEQRLLELSAEIHSLSDLQDEASNERLAEIKKERDDVEEMLQPLREKAASMRKLGKSLPKRTSHG